MEATLLRHPRLQVWVRTGSEGPRHDPYAYTETTITVPKGTIVIHDGLGEWVTINGKAQPAPKGMPPELDARGVLIQMFTGYTIEQINRMHRKLKSRCARCGGKRFHSESGFPGETFEICEGCGHVHDSYFDRSAIE